MTLKYGFYDSLNGDRKYNAADMSGIFDGIITDGVFSSIGSAFGVTAYPSSMSVVIGIGRAWFKRTWTFNDGDMYLTIPASHATLNRIDSVILEVDSSPAVRANTIKILTGTPAASPTAPTLAHTSTLNQYSLADVYVGAGVTTINSGNITIKVGTSATPFASGAVPMYDYGPMVTSWTQQFTTWFNNLVNQLSGSQVANLQAEIDTLTANVNKLDNYKITPSVAGGNLTLAIKTLAGTDPSSSDPSRFKVGDTVFNLTAGVSFTKNSATNYMNLGGAELAGQPVDLFVYAISESGASAGLKFAYSRVPYGRFVGDFSSTTIAFNHLCGNLVNFNSTDPVVNIGRFRAQMSSGLVWSIASQNIVNRPIYESSWLNYTEQNTGYSSNPSATCSYKIVNDICHINRFLTANGTSNSTAATLSFPFAFVVSSAVLVWAGVTDNGSLLSTPGHLQSTAGSNVASVYKTFYQGAWTATGAKGQNIPDFNYRIR